MTLPLYFDRDGQPITLVQWSERFHDLGYSHVRVDALGDDVLVSTVWIGLDLGLGAALGTGPPIIFESMVFGSELDGECRRYATLEQAEHGHDELVEAVRAFAHG